MDSSISYNLRKPELEHMESMQNKKPMIGKKYCKFFVAWRLIGEILISEGLQTWPVSPKYNTEFYKDMLNRPENNIFSTLFFLYCKWYRDLTNYITVAEAEMIKNKMHTFYKNMVLHYQKAGWMSSHYIKLIRYIEWQMQNDKDLAVLDDYVVSNFYRHHADMMMTKRSHGNHTKGVVRILPEESAVNSRMIFQVMEPIARHQGYWQEERHMVSTLACNTEMRMARQHACLKMEELHHGSTGSALNTCVISQEDEEKFVESLLIGKIKTRNGKNMLSEGFHIRCASMYIGLSRMGARGQNVREIGLNSLTMNPHPNMKTPKKCYAISTVQRKGKDVDACGGKRNQENTFHFIHSSELRYDAVVHYANHIIYHADLESSMFNPLLDLLKKEFDDLLNTGDSKFDWKAFPMFPSETGKKISYSKHAADTKTLFNLNEDSEHTKVTHALRYTALLLLLASDAGRNNIAMLLKWQTHDTLNSTYAKGSLGGSELFQINYWLSAEDYAPWWFQESAASHPDIPKELWDNVAPIFDKIEAVAKNIFKKFRTDKAAERTIEVLQVLRVVFIESSVFLRMEYSDRGIYTRHPIFANAELRTIWNAYAVKHLIKCLADKYNMIDNFKREGTHVRAWPLYTDDIDEDKRHPVNRIREEKTKTIDIFPKIRKLCTIAGHSVEQFIDMVKASGNQGILKHILPNKIPKKVMLAVVKDDGLDRLEAFPTKTNTFREIYDIWTSKYKAMYEKASGPRGIPWKKLGGTKNMCLIYNRTIDFLKYTENELENHFMPHIEMEKRTKMYFDIFEEFLDKLNDTIDLPCNKISPGGWVRMHFYYIVSRKCNEEDMKKMVARKCTPNDLRVLFRSKGLTVPKIKHDAEEDDD